MSRIRKGEKAAEVGTDAELHGEDPRSGVGEAVDGEDRPGPAPSSGPDGESVGNEELVGGAGFDLEPNG